MADQEAGDTGVLEIISLLVGLVQQGKPPKSILVVYEDEEQVYVQVNTKQSEEPLMGVLNQTLRTIFFPTGGTTALRLRAEVALKALMEARKTTPLPQTPKGEQN